MTADFANPACMSPRWLPAGSLPGFFGPPCFTRRRPVSPIIAGLEAYLNFNSAPAALASCNDFATTTATGCPL